MRSDVNPQLAHLKAITQESALRFVGVAVANVHPVCGLRRKRARGDHFAAFLRRGAQTLSKNKRAAATDLELAKHRRTLLRRETEHGHPRIGCVWRRGPLRAVLRSAK